MRLMAASDDLRFQCYLLDADDADEILQQPELFEHLSEKDVCLLNEAKRIKSYADNPHAKETEKRFILLDMPSSRLIGRSRILMRTHDFHAFTGFHIVENMRGNKLAHILYAAQMEYLHSIAYKGNIRLSIVRDKEHEPSLGAALSNGFRIIEKRPKTDALERNMDGYVPKSTREWATLSPPQARPDTLDR